MFVATVVPDIEFQNDQTRQLISLARTLETIDSKRYCRTRLYVDGSVLHSTTLNVSVSPLDVSVRAHHRSGKSSALRQYEAGRYVSAYKARRV